MRRRPILTALILVCAIAAPVSADVLADAQVQAARMTLERTVQPTPSPQRNQAMFWGGVALVAIGAAVLIAVEEDCEGLRINDRCLGETTWPAGQITGGAVTAGVGALMMTVWAR